MEPLEFELLEQKFSRHDQILGNVTELLGKIIERQDKIMAQIDDLNAKIATIQTTLTTLGTDMASAFSDLEAEVNALGTGVDLSGPIAALAAINGTIQTLAANAVTADPKNAPVISSPLTLAAPINTAVTYQIAASNNPTSFDAVGLPTGLTAVQATGVISGTPTVAGVSNVTIKAINASGTGVATLVITVA